MKILIVLFTLIFYTESVNAAVVKLSEDDFKSLAYTSLVLVPICIGILIWLKSILNNEGIIQTEKGYIIPKEKGYCTLIIYIIKILLAGLTFLFIPFIAGIFIMVASLFGGGMESNTKYNPEQGLNSRIIPHSEVTETNIETPTFEEMGFCSFNGKLYDVPINAKCAPHDLNNAWLCDEGYYEAWGDGEAKGQQVCVNRKTGEYYYK